MVFCWYNFINNTVIIFCEYKERLGYNLLTELQNQTLSNLNARFMSSMKQDNVLKSAIKSTFKTDDFQMLMVKLHKTYCDPRNVDKMDLVQNTIKETKIIIKEDITKTLGMKEELLVSTIDLKL